MLNYFKSINTYFVLYFFIINIFCTKKIISEDSSLVQISSYSYPQSLTLLNGDILISTTDGFYFYDSLLTTLIKSYKYNDNLVFSDIDTLKNIILRQFSQDDKIIICFVSATLYIFSADGKSLLNNTSLSLSSYFFYMTPFNTDNNSYYFFLCYENNNHNLQLLYYSIDKTTYTLNKKHTFVFEQRSILQNNFSCLTMYSLSDGLRLTCFITISDDGYKVIASTFNVIDTGASEDTNVQISQTNDFVYAENDGQSNYMKSAVNSDLS